MPGGAAQPWRARDEVLSSASKGPLASAGQLPAQEVHSIPLQLSFCARGGGPLAGLPNSRLGVKPSSPVGLSGEQLIFSFPVSLYVSLTHVSVVSKLSR